MRKEISTAGPAKFAAALPVSTKMPEPMMQPTPKNTRCHAPRLRLRSCTAASRWTSPYGLRSRPVPVESLMPAEHESNPPAPSITIQPLSGIELTGSALVKDKQAARQHVADDAFGQTRLQLGATCFLAELARLRGRQSVEQPVHASEMRSVRELVDVRDLRDRHARVMQAPVAVRQAHDAEEPRGRLADGLLERAIERVVAHLQASRDVRHRQIFADEAIHDRDRAPHERLADLAEPH